MRIIEMVNEAGVFRGCFLLDVSEESDAMVRKKAC